MIDLAQIKARAEKLSALPVGIRSNYHDADRVVGFVADREECRPTEVLGLVHTDIPALIARVEELKAALKDLADYASVIESRMENRLDAAELVEAIEAARAILGAQS